MNKLLIKAPRKKQDHIESTHQKFFFAKLDILYRTKVIAVTERMLTFAVPNGGKRDAITARILKSEGVSAGVPDILCLVPKKGYHGLAIELKRPIVKGRSKPAVSDAQKNKIKLLNEVGYLALVCYGFQDAFAEYCDYLEISDVIYN